MARELNGSELAGFIKERQAKQVRNLRQEHKIIPKLLIVKSVNASDVIDVYVRMKQRYASDVLIEVEVVSCQQKDMHAIIHNANDDMSVHGIIVQLPIDSPEETNSIVGQIAPQKDVDGLGEKADYISATAEAIDWLLAGYNIELVGRSITLLGRGRLVGAPLEKLWRGRGLNVTVLDDQSDDADSTLANSDVIVSATGVPRILTSEKVHSGAVVVDAGTTSEQGVIVGDVDPSLRERSDVTLTPEKGGVGPLTIVLMFDHVIQAALKMIK